MAEKKKYDAIIVGGGPAGMMAAGRAGESGARVLLLEKNKSLGKKLLMTGNGRCNLTQAEFDDKEFVKKLNDKKAKFLFSSLASFGPEEAIDFFEKRGLKIKIEKTSRVFPATDKAEDVLGVLVGYLEKNKVEIIFGSEVLDFETVGEKIKAVKIKHQEEVKKISAKNFIIATGGKSYPATGSSGDGYSWAKSLGHTIVPPAPALAPIKVKEGWIKDLQGLKLEDARISIVQNGKEMEMKRGEILFTHFGLSGPMILNISKKIGELVKNGEVGIEIDLFPNLDATGLDGYIQRKFFENSKKEIKTFLGQIFPQRLADKIIFLAEIDPKKKLNYVTKDERKRLADLMKDFRLNVEGLMGFNQAMVTSGGVNLKEIDSKTMRSKKINNLFFAGEILDLDGPTGGYNLQIAWSTGYAAGENTAKQLK
ncbi:MAG TPA: aminoacetone oxidase family FAD-binding enzyme [Candidatus Moranbacteria bacterium]|nr:aminoacetone oxidase family FAD-binding enzyme [Candidatus Moranbacteria bacterium]